MKQRIQPLWLCAFAAVIASGCGRIGAPSSTQSDESLERHSQHADVIGDAPLAGNPNIALGYPTMTGDEPEVLISRSQYVISWNKQRRNPNWVAWRLTSANIGSTGRSNDFAIDSELSTYLTAHHAGTPVGPNDYRGSCFDRGHQIPSGDRTDVVANNRATFLMSNMAPQTAYLNRVIWEHLEAYARTLEPDSSAAPLYQIVGTVYPDQPAAIGPNHDIAVPSFSFKVIARLPRRSSRNPHAHPSLVTAVMMPNVNSDGSDPIANNAKACNDAAASTSAPASGDEAATDWQRYEVSVAQIEAAAHVDLSFLN